MSLRFRFRSLMPELAGTQRDPTRSSLPGDGSTCMVTIDGRRVRVPAGVTVAAALEIEGCADARRSATGQRRQAFCGMGVCGECRVTVDGRAHRLACQTPCTPDLEIRRDA